jgi:hypothetical protein
MRFRLATSGADGGGQQLAGGVGNLFRSVAMAPAMAAQAAQEAQQAQGQMDLQAAQTALFRNKSAEIDDQRSRSSLGSMLQTAQMVNGVPMSEQADFGNFLQTGQMAGRYEPPVDGVGPRMPVPKFYDDGTAQRILQTLGLTNTALTVGDSNSLNIAKGAGEYQDQRITDQAVALAGKGDDMGMSRLNAIRGKKEFTPFAAVGTTGTALNQITGAQDVSNEGLRVLFGDKTAAEIEADKARAGASRASAASSYASADNSRASASKTRFEMGQGAAPGSPGATGGPGAPPATGKPMPATALKMQNEALDVIGIASSTQADLGTIRQQIKDGKLDFGPIKNVYNQGLNMAGMSTEQSKNFATFKSTLEKLRNDSLRLNKGVQTDGDAQRAWSELLQNINDRDLVDQRLQEIERINARAVDLRKREVEDIRNNYRQPQYDFSGQTSVPSALGGGTGAGQSTADPLGLRR